MLSTLFSIFFILAATAMAAVPAPLNQARAVSCSTPDGDGVCISTDSTMGGCKGFLVEGFCSGDTSVQCCVPTSIDDNASGEGDAGGDVPDDENSDGVQLPDEIAELLEEEIASGGTLDADEILRRTAAATTKKVTKAQLLVNAAKRWIGTRYVFGGGNCAGPTKGGFDCSGLVLHAVCKATGKKLVHSAQSQYLSKHGKHIPLSKAVLGDTVFWAYGKKCKSQIHHVAIYLGASKGIRYIIHAPNRNSKVKIAKLWTQDGSSRICDSAVRYW